MLIEVAIIEDGRRADALSDALIEAGALSSAIEDAAADHDDEHALYGEPGSTAMTSSTSTWPTNRVVALFDAKAAVDDALLRAFAAIGLAPDTPVVRREIADENWVALTQAQFAPMRIGSRLWVVPSWHALPDEARDANAIVLTLDPGMAFGTGDHPTTRLCLAWLDEYMPRGARVIDYGTGSGILAIAAAKLGASTVAGTDIDEQAMIAARANAIDNRVAVSFASSYDFTSPPVDVVVANILSNPLKVLAPLLTTLVADGGWLVLSGVLERQVDEVSAAYAPGLRLDAWRVEAGWACLVARRNATAR